MDCFTPLNLIGVKGRERKKQQGLMRMTCVCVGGDTLLSGCSSEERRKYNREERGKKGSRWVRTGKKVWMEVEGGREDRGMGTRQQEGEEDDNTTRGEGREGGREREGGTGGREEDEREERE